MEKPAEKPNAADGSTAPGAPPAEEPSPAPAAGVSRAGPPAETAAGVQRLELAEEPPTEMERPSGAQQEGPDAFKAALPEGDCPSSKPLVTLTNSNSREAGGFAAAEPCSNPAPLDLDCLICFNKYNIYRVPKVLECQHAFCAVCLKLILRREEGAWTITCPLCRKATAVCGGLIRTLQNKQDIMEHLENANPEVHVSAVGLDGGSWPQAGRDALYGDENAPADNRLAVQRLVLLLLLVVILTILILPFMYSGLVKWAICLMLILGLVMSMVLCCTPKLYWTCNKDSFTSCHKETHITAIA